MGKISVKSFDSRGSLTGHSSGSSTGGEVTNHTPMPGSYTPDEVPQENQACCLTGAEGEVSVALAPGADTPCSPNAVVAKAAPDSVFRGVSNRPMLSKEAPNPRTAMATETTSAPTTGNTDSVARVGVSKALSTSDSISNPSFGFRNGAGNNNAFIPPGVPEKPGRPND
jgi:hypothetical protein